MVAASITEVGDDDDVPRIGLGLTLIHLVGIPVTNTSVNPARSTGTALLVGGWAVQQLWMLWVAPIVDALFGAFTYRAIADERE